MPVGCTEKRERERGADAIPAGWPEKDGEGGARDWQCPLAGQRERERERD